MNTELRSTGASFVAGRERDNPRDLVIDVVKNNPQASRSDQFEQFRALLQESGGDYQRAVDWYFFVNMQSYLTGARDRSDPVTRAAATKQRENLVESIKAQIVLLELPMPNGKAMRDCTGGEMAKFGNRYQRIAEKVGKTKTVGAVLNEDQVRTILK